MKSFSFVVTLAVVALLTACGGGEEVTNNYYPATTPPAAQTPGAVVPEADVTLVQDLSVLNVTPGETVRITSLRIDCKQDKTAPGGSDRWCLSHVPLGDLGIVVAGLEIMDIKVLIDGQELTGWVNKEADGLYRFRSEWIYPIYRTGSIEIIATISPHATSGEYSLVVFKADDTAFDKTLTVIPAAARVEVKALAQYAPMTLSASEGTVVYQGKLDELVVKTVSIVTQCAPGTTCSAEIDFGDVFGLIPNTPFQVRVTYANGDQSFWSVADANADGLATVGTIWLPGDAQVEIKVYTLGTAYIYARSITGMSGDKKIAPKRPTTCTAVSGEYCKG